VVRALTSDRTCTEGMAVLLVTGFQVDARQNRCKEAAYQRKAGCGFCQQER